LAGSGTIEAVSAWPPPVRHAVRVVVRFLLADALSLLGNAVVGIALPWIVLSRTGEATAAGTVAAASAVPALLAALAGGVLIDRLGRRRMSVIADLASAASVAALPLVDAATGLTLTWFIVLGVAGALFDVPGQTARQALLPDVAAAARMPLERLSGLRVGFSRAALLIGPAAAGGLLLILDDVLVLWVTAACSALAAALTATLPARVSTPAAAGDDDTQQIAVSAAVRELAMVLPGSGGRHRAMPQRRRAPRHRAPAGPSFGTDLKAGAAVLVGDPVQRTLTVLVTAQLIVLAPLNTLLLPAHLLRTNSAGVLGLVISGVAVGGIVSALVYATVGTRVTRRAWYVSGMLLIGAGVAGLGALPSPPLLIACAVLAGLGTGPVGALLIVLVAERVPAAARGRVLGLQNAAGLTAAPVGLAAGGFLIDGVGVARTGMLVSASWLLFTVVALLAPAMRRINRPGAPQGDRLWSLERQQSVTHDGGDLEGTRGRGRRRVEDVHLPRRGLQQEVVDQRPVRGDGLRAHPRGRGPQVPGSDPRHQLRERRGERPA